MAAMVLEVGRGKLSWWPGLTFAFMYLILGGIPLMAVMITIPLIPQTPWLLLLWPVALFPAAAITVVRMMLSLMALRVFDDGQVQIVQPFKTSTYAPGRLSTIRLATTYMSGSNARMTWLHFFEPGAARSTATISANVFNDAELQAFLDAARARNPNLVVELS